MNSEKEGRQKEGEKVLSSRVAFSKTLLRRAQKDPRIIAITSDTKGSVKLKEFADALPQQSFEVGIAEQNAVGVAAGFATTGKKPFVCGHACFYSTRVYEHIKNDVAYTGANVKILGASGGLSYGQLGATHHSLQDIAAIRGVPDIGILLPADYYQAERATDALVDNKDPYYMRIGRNPRPTVYDEFYSPEDVPFELEKANRLMDGDEVTLIAAGKMVKPSVDAARQLRDDGIRARVIDMHTIKPLDEESILQAAAETGHIITVEEHRIHGGLGSAVAEVVAQNRPVPMKILGIPDEFSVGGDTEEIFSYYGLDSDSIAETAKDLLQN